MDKMGFTMTIDVTSDHLDALNHVNNLEYLKWGESIAKKHWDSLIRGKDLKPHIWVIIKHEIAYKREGLLGDTIDITTWVGQTSGLRSVRHFEFHRGKDLLAKMDTTYCLIDWETRKPIKISEEIKNILLTSV